jgi:hypothetical protein
MIKTNARKAVAGSCISIQDFLPYQPLDDPSQAQVQAIQREVPKFADDSLERPVNIAPALPKFQFDYAIA